MPVWLLGSIRELSLFEFVTILLRVGSETETIHGCRPWMVCRGGPGTGPPLHTTIDGRGASVHIAGGSCVLLYKVTSVIIHGIRIHHCRPQSGGPVLGPDSKVMQMSPTDGDAIRLVGASKIWIDHNTLYECTDGLLDVTRGSTDVTVSNNWFKNHDKVMLLGHDDGFRRDKNMRVTVAFNHFGPDCFQRMPRPVP